MCNFQKLGNDPIIRKCVRNTVRTSSRIVSTLPSCLSYFLFVLLSWKLSHIISGDFYVYIGMAGYTAATVYTLIAIQFVAAVLSLIVVLGLLIPLVIQLKDGRYYEQSKRKSSLAIYSSYNLYLVYLSSVDFFFLLLIMIGEIRAMQGKFDPRFWSAIRLPEGVAPPNSLKLEAVVANPYAAANFWINAVIFYEVVILLKASKQARRITQPSLKRVNLQGGGVILGSILHGIFYYYNLLYGWVNPDGVGSIALYVPIVYVFGTTIFVVWRGYVPSIGTRRNTATSTTSTGSLTPINRAIRGLAFYFLRILLVFVFLWLPGVVLGAFALREVDSYSGMVLSLLLAILLAIQPIVSFCMILTKPDVKQYIWDLVNLSYFRKDRGRASCYSGKTQLGVNQETNTSENSRNDPTNGGNQGSTRRVRILGYNFSIVDSDDTENVNIETKEDTTNIANGDSADVTRLVDGGDKHDKTVMPTGDV